MKSVFLTVVVAGVFLNISPGAVAQHADFTGMWDFDEEASELPEFIGGRGGFGGRGGLSRPSGGVGLTLVITQTDDILAIEHQSDRGSRTLTYHLDGTASLNPGPRGEQTTRSQ